MLSLFNEDLKINYPNMLSGKYDRFKRTSILNMDRTKEHLLSRAYTVFSNHLLMKLIKTISPPSTLSESALRSYYDDLRNNYYKYSSSIGYASPTYTGAVNKSQFYSDDVSEIIIGTASKYNEIKSLPWQELEPVKVHRHPYSCTYYGILDKRQTIPGKGVAVISIDIPTLAYQYIRWSMEQKDLERSDPLGAFIVQYPLRNMLKSHNDIAIINRVIAKYAGVRYYTPAMKQAFWLNDDMMVLDGVLDQLIPELKRTPRFFDAILMQLPTVYKTGYDAVRLPFDISVRQTDWVWLIARMRVVTWLLMISVSFRQEKEGVKFNEIQHSLQKIKGDGILRLRNVPRMVSKTVDEDLMLLYSSLASLGRTIK